MSGVGSGPYWASSDGYPYQSIPCAADSNVGRTTALAPYRVPHWQWQDSTIKGRLSLDASDRHMLRRTPLNSRWCGQGYRRGRLTTPVCSWQPQ